MSRGRSLYAMGARIFRSDIQRRKAVDVFERDPFKIQSYNFRYADRPTYPVQNYRRDITVPSSNDKDFESLYYNPDFERHQNKENLPYHSVSNTQFQEFRRRKFLQDFRSVNTSNINRPVDVCKKSGLADVSQQVRTSVSRQLSQCSGFRGSISLTGGLTGGLGANTLANKATTANTPLLRTCCNNDYLRTSRGSSTSCLIRQASSSILMPIKTASKRELGGRTTQPRSASQINLLQRQSRVATVSSRNLLRASNILIGTRAVNARHASNSAIVDGSTHCLLQPSSPCTLLGNGNGKSDVRRNNNRSNAPCATVNPGSTLAGSKAAAAAAARANANHRLNNTHSNNLLNAKLERKKSNCSGCEININISQMDDANDSESVCIKIATDACLLDDASTRSRSSTSCLLDDAKTQNSIDSFVIDKRLSKYSLRNKNSAPNEELRERIRDDIVRDRARFAERERERERLRERERELDRDRLRVLDHERELDRIRALERERENQRERERAIERRRREAEVASMKAANKRPPNMMQSHLYHRTSAERVPSIVPFRLERGMNTSAPSSPRSQLSGGASPRSQHPRQTMNTLSSGKADNSGADKINSNNMRSKRLQAHVDGGLNSLRGLKRPASVLDRKLSRTSQTSNNAAVPSNQPVRNAGTFTASKPQERKILNVTNPLHTRLNNVPIRITASMRGMRTPDEAGGPGNGNSRNIDDLTFESVRIRNDTLNSMRGKRQFTLGGGKSSVSGGGSQGPYNVNINVYADKLKMMRI